MATILELAQHSGVSAETVLRVILREPVNEEAQRKVGEAIGELGMPAYPRPDGHVEVLPAQTATEGADVVSAAAAAPYLVAELRGLFGELLESVVRERRERVDDVSLTTELIIEGWRNVDRRLGRLEKIVERLGSVAYLENGNGEAASSSRGREQVP